MVAMEWPVALITILFLAVFVKTIAHSLFVTTPETSDKTQSSKLSRFETPNYIEVFQCAYYYSALAGRRMLIWDYRDQHGILHSGVASSHEQAVQAAMKFGYSPSNGDRDHPEIE